MSALSTSNLYPPSGLDSPIARLERSPTFSAFGPSMSLLGVGSTGMERAGSAGSVGAGGSLRNGGGAVGKDEYEDIQHRVFVKWLNARLEPGGFEPLVDLGTDFADGTKLIQLIELLTGESLGRYNRSPVMRVQRAENVSKALDKIRAMGVLLTNIGPEDVMDGNRKLVLGMIWSLVQRFTIAAINEEGSHAKEGLLLWCQKKTASYEEVDVQNFTRSWQDGLAFCALINKHRPDLIDYDSLQKDQFSASQNVELAFKVAEEHLGVPRLLEVEDVCGTKRPDERSVMTYVAQFFHAFSTKAQQETAAKVLHLFAQHMKSIVTGVHDYESRAKNFLSSITSLLADWSSNPPSPPYSSLKASRAHFNTYKQSQRREFVQEKRDVLALLVHLQIKLDTYGLKGYEPPEGVRPEDIETKWSEFLKAEEARCDLIHSEMEKLRLSSLTRLSTHLTAFLFSLSSLSAQLSTPPPNALEEYLHSLSLLSTSLLQLRKTGEPLLLRAEKECRDYEVPEIELEGNRHFSRGVKDVMDEWEEVGRAVKGMKAFVENQVVARGAQNVRPEQLEEWESAFRAFVGHGQEESEREREVLDFEELDAALSSLGISEVSLGQFDPEGVSFEAFIKFLVDRNDDRQSVAKVMNSFREAGKDKGYVTEVDLKRLQLPESSFEFLRDYLPKEKLDGEGDEGELYMYDYENFVDALCN